MVTHEVVTLMLFSIAVFVFYMLASNLAFRKNNHIEANTILDELDLSRENFKTGNGKSKALKVTATVVAIFSIMLGAVSVALSHGLPILKIVVMPVSVMAVYQMSGFFTGAKNGRAVRVILAVSAVSVWLVFPSWITINLLALIAASYVLIAHRNVKIGHIWAISAGILMFDAVSVFGTSLMENMAVNALDTPLLLTAPQSAGQLVRPELSNIAFALGLGDIIIPGLIIMLAAGVAHARKAPMVQINTILGYIVGLFVTFWVATTYDAAQPATIYLIPSTLGVYLLSRFLANRNIAAARYSMSASS